ncbi:Small ubiquitin-related modifier, SUMO [Corchorus capsularis]|uniref:Small ubiquitin-related modifier, SUMO n=1 Tax=Corchorus capsularis TaxID=210143 RepID=A0A1R3JW48_COCAP|nr:Small ubiquitin-related modifier, SUMO [Corchorus capsularis]
MDMSRERAGTESTLVTLSSPVVEGKRIFLHVKGPRETDQFSYWITRNTPLRTLIHDYTQRIGLTFNSVRFRYCGASPVNPGSTPHDLDMKDGDSIDVIPWENFVVTGASQSSMISLPRMDEEKPILLKVIDVIKGGHVFYRIGRNTPLHYLMLDHFERIGVRYSHGRFFYDGKCIEPYQTADDLGMEDGDHIDAWRKSVIETLLCDFRRLFR